jgi:hypothetical protein
MPYGTPAQLANLKSWKPGAAPKGGRRSAAVAKALRALREACPRCVELLIGIVRDETEHTALRLKAVELILKYGMPKGAAEIDFGTAEPSVLELRFIDHGIEYSYAEWQARSAAAKALDRLPVTSQQRRLPPPALENAPSAMVVRLALPQRAVPVGQEKVPSLQARMRAGILR